jgi:hypothetical protein
MAIDPTTTTTVKVSELASAGYNTTDLIPHEVAGILKKGNLQDLATFIGSIIDVEGSVGFRAVNVTDGQTLPATTEEEFILVGPGTFPNVGGGSAITTTEPLNALVSNGTYWFIGVEIPIAASGAWGSIEGNIETQTDLQDALDLKADLVDGKVPASQLPSYVDDVVEVANYAALPSTGETGKIYITIDTNKVYRWSGSAYIEIAENNAVWGLIEGTLSSQTDLNTALGLKVPYTGATGNVDLGSHKLTASDLVVNHASGSGAAATISKGGNGEALTVTKSSGSGNAASILGGVTLLDELHLNTDLADAYIASAATWNAKQAALNGTGFVKISGTTISYDNTTYLSGTVAIANGGTGATTAGAARINLGATTVGANIFTIPNPNPVTKAYIRANADNTVEWLDGNAFRESIGAGTGNGSVTSVNGTGSYGGLTLTGTVTGSGDLTLGGTPTGTWPISVSGNAASVNTVFNTTNADHYITFADANNGSPTAEFLYTVGTLKYNPNTGALTAGSFVKSGGTSSQFLMADGSVSTGSGGTVTSVAAITLGTTGTDLSSTVANGTTTPVITLNVPTASATNRGALSSADWTTFNSKQNALTNPVTGTGTTNYIPKFTGSSAIGNSSIFDNGTNVGIGTASPAYKLQVNKSESGSNPSAVLRLENTGAYYTSKLTLTDGTTNDANISYLGANQSLGFGIGSSLNQMVLLSTGNVGIGTTSPTKKLHIKGGNDSVLFLDNGGERYTTQYFANNGTTKSFLVWDNTNSLFEIGTAVSSDLRLLTNNAERIRIFSNGNTFIGSTPTDAGYKLDVNGTARASVFSVNANGTIQSSGFWGTLTTAGAGSYADWAVINSATNAIMHNPTGTLNMVFSGSVTTEKGIFRNSGVPAIQVFRDLDVTSVGPAGQGIEFGARSGTTYIAGAAIYGGLGNPGTTGNLVFQTLNGGSLGTRLTITSAGAATFSSTVTATGFFNSSDIRLKDVTDYDYNVSEIKPMNYYWKDKRDDKKHVGYSAQEVQKVMPDAVNEDEKGFLSVNYVEVLVAKISQMEKEIAYLKSKI